MKDEGGRMNMRHRRPVSFSSFILPTSALLSGAGDETRTRDPQLGRLMLYQLSYTRSLQLRIANFGLRNRISFPGAFSDPKSAFRNRSGAGGRIRTYVGQ